jgi:hypothetical protein
MPNTTFTRCVVIETIDGENKVRKESLCGEPYNPRKWYFDGVSHWMLSTEQGGKLLLCRGCAERIESALQRGTSNEMTGPEDHVAGEVKVDHGRVVRRYSSRLVVPTLSEGGHKFLLSLGEDVEGD